VFIAVLLSADGYSLDDVAEKGVSCMTFFIGHNFVSGLRTLKPKKT